MIRTRGQLRRMNNGKPEGPQRGRDQTKTYIQIQYVRQNINWDVEEASIRRTSHINGDPKDGSKQQQQTRPTTMTTCIFGQPILFTRDRANPHQRAARPSEQTCVATRASRPGRPPPTPYPTRPRATTARLSRVRP